MIVVPRRLLDHIDDARAVIWPSPFDDGVRQIAQARAEGQSVAVVATGDPMHFGIGGTLVRRLGSDAIVATPMPSAFSLAAARMGWPVESAEQLSLHGIAQDRAVAALERVTYPGARLLLLSEGARTPATVADWLVGRGFGRSSVTVLERMGCPDERVRAWTADGFPGDATFDALNTLAVECDAGTDARWHGASPGLPDAAFAHDGQLTKQDVRAITISALKPFPRGVLWDVGAGCGSISIEWLRPARGGRAYAIEPREERRGMIARNAEGFGLGGLHAVEGNAPDAYSNLPTPDSVFVGGGIAMDGVAEGAISALRTGGVFVANAVTLEGETKLAALHAEYGGDLRRVAISHCAKIGPFRGWRPSMAVTMLRFVKQ